MNENIKLYEKAIEKWGVESQINMIKEELAELIVTLCKFERNINGADIYKIADEVADVEIMLEQLYVIFKHREEGKWAIIVNERKQHKLNRLREYLRGDE